jgi:hypothetical protein
VGLTARGVRLPQGRQWPVKMKQVIDKGGMSMNVQVIERDGQAEYAVLPWAE